MIETVLFCLLFLVIFTLYILWIFYFFEIPIILRIIPFLPLIIYFVFFTWPGGEVFHALFPPQKKWNVTDNGTLFHYNGTGVYINPSDVITNAHVIERCHHVGIIKKDTFYPATIVAIISGDYNLVNPHEPDMKPGADLAILRTSHRQPYFAALSLSPPIIDETVTFANLSPWQRGKFYRREGRVLDLEDIYFSFSGISRPGNSGSPVYNTQGMLTGILHSVRKNPILPSNNLATQSRFIARFLLENHIAFTTILSKTSLQHEFAVGIGCHFKEK